MKDIWKYFIGLSIGIGIGLLLNTCSSHPISDPKIIYTEVHDTVTINKEKIKYKTKIDSVLTLDTFYIKEFDTVYLHNLPIEYKSYLDTISTDSTSTQININYHGFDAEIDNVQLDHQYNNKTEIIYIPPKKWGLDVTVGPSIGWDWNPGCSPSGNFAAGINVTFGISYRITK